MKEEIINKAFDEITHEMDVAAKDGMTNAKLVRFGLRLLSILEKVYDAGAEVTINVNLDN